MDEWERQREHECFSISISERRNDTLSSSERAADEKRAGQPAKTSREETQALTFLAAGNRKPSSLTPSNRSSSSLPPVDAPSEPLVRLIQDLFRERTARERGNRPGQRAQKGVFLLWPPADRKKSRRRARSFSSQAFGESCTPRSLEPRRRDGQDSKEKKKQTLMIPTRTCYKKEEEANAFALRISRGKK